jgi:hypothetical protein
MPARLKLPVTLFGVRNVPRTRHSDELTRLRALIGIDPHFSDGLLRQSEASAIQRLYLLGVVAGAPVNGDNHVPRRAEIRACDERSRRFREYNPLHKDRSRRFSFEE